MSLNLNALQDLSGIDHSLPGSAATWLSDPSASQTSCTFASLVDLARMQFGASSVEICDACNTVNLGSAHYCKGCAHKLPAYYAACEREPKLPRLEESSLPMRRTWSLVNRASFTDFAAFALVVNLLVMVAEFMPIQ